MLAGRNDFPVPDFINVGFVTSFLRHEVKKNISSYGSSLNSIPGDLASKGSKSLGVEKN